MASSHTIAIVITRVALTDGSHVFNVKIGGLGLIMRAVSENDATQLADKIEAAINEHTVDSATVVYE